MRRLTLLALLLGCDPSKGTETGTSPVDTGGPDSSTDDSSPDSGADSDTSGDSDSAGDSADSGAWDCEALPELPVEDDQYLGFTSAEDFAFTADGQVLAVDGYGNLVETTIDGTETLLRPGIGTVAGTRILPGGDVVVANYGVGEVQRISLTDGSVSTLVSGLPYPNGLDIGLDGMIYVADTTLGQVLKIDPDTGESSVVAEGMYSPNGVAVSVDGETLYIGSFGGGTVYAISRVGEGFERPRIYGTTPDSPGVPTDDCPDLAEGDECMFTSGTGVGNCASDDDGLYCTLQRDEAACEGLAEGDPCSSTLFGEPVESLCVTDGGGALFCPRTEGSRVSACDGKTAYQRCNFDGERGYCYPSWEGENVCMGDSEYMTLYEEGCEGLDIGEECMLNLPSGAMAGVCSDGSAYGFDGAACLPPYWTSMSGGLDGIGVDACGQVYVAEYISGKLMRFAAEGSDAELVARLRSSWIPNLHWGVGAGGFERDVLYVADRTNAGIFGVYVGVGGRPELYP